MKKTKKTLFGRILFPAAALLTALFILSSCDNGGTPDVSDTVPDTTAAEISKINLAGGEYVIIRPDDDSADTVSLAKEIQAAVSGKTGKTPEIRVDFIAEKAGYVESPYEIILGVCNRQASRDVFSGLKYNDYEIRICGTQLVICGGCDDALKIAVRKFCSEILTDDGSLTGDVLLRYGAEYPVSEILVNGKDVSEYTIVYSYAKRTVYENPISLIVGRVRQLTGQTLTAVPSSQYEGSGPTIEFGDCKSALSSGITVSGTGYRSVVSDGSAAFACEVSRAASQKVLEILDKYVPASSSGKLSVTLENKDESGEIQLGTALCPGANLRVMTSNVLGGSTLKDRIPLLAEIYSEYMPDFIGLQEAESSAHSGLTSQLGSLYDIACSKIGSTSNTCYTPILYRKEKYKVVESGSSLFDSRWPKTNTKTYAWAVFEDLQSGKKIAVINAHWSLILGSYDTESVFGKKLTDNVDGKEWRVSNSKQILAKKDELRGKYGNTLPVIVMGDMNANTSAESVKVLGNGMKNCLNAATVSRTSGKNSFHNNPGTAISGTDPIDNIFVTDDVISVFTHEIVMTKTAINSSDHCQVVVDIAY